MSTEATSPFIELRRLLLALHRSLLAEERSRYERQHGPVHSNGQFLQLLIHDSQFAWIQPFTEKIVQGEQWLDANELMINEHFKSFLTDMQQLLRGKGPTTTWDDQWKKALALSPDLNTQAHHVIQFIDRVGK